MAAYTPSLRLTLPVTGTDDGTWGDTVNNGITSLTDSSIAGTATVIQGDVANYTLTNLSGATDEARNMFLNITGALTAARNVVCPTASKLYFIKNSTTGGFAVTLKTSGGTGISVPAGSITALYCDGTNVVNAITYANIPVINATTVDTTNLEVTNIKAKDGTASITLADSTGVASFTANPIISGGTANGVAYLNGTKVLTTGAALTFDGTNLIVGGSATEKLSSNGALRVSGAVTTSATGTVVSNQGSSLGLLGVWGANTSTIGALQFYLSDSTGSLGGEQMRLTSTGLGIGTTSPAIPLSIGAPATGFYGSTSVLNFYVNTNLGATLDSSGNLGLGVTPSAWNVFPAFQTTGNYALSALGYSSNMYYQTGFKYMTTDLASRYEQASGQHRWFNAPSGTAGNAITFTQAMTLDASGNLGLGVTPSAWGNITALQIKSGSLSAGSVDTYLSSNAFYNTSSPSGWKYISTTFATQFYQNAAGGEFVWRTAPSGTAGNAITFTQAMTLDASGNLGVGTSSPTAKLTVDGGAHIRGYTAPNTSFQSIVLGITGGEAFLQPYTTGLSQIPLNIEGSTIKLNTGGSTRATLDSSGNLGLGVTPSAWNNIFAVMQLGSDGAWVGGRADGQNQAWLGTNAFWNGSNWTYKAATTAGQFLIKGNEFQFLQAPTGTIGGAASFTQAMTLDASGNLLVGTTTNPGSRSLGFSANAGGNGIDIYQIPNMSDWAINATSGSICNFYSDNGTALVYAGSISVNGNVTTYGSVSDQRLKENIQDAASASALIDALQVREYDWKSDGSHQRYGFVAQELVTVAPEAVHQPADPEEMMAVDYSKLVPMLVKEIQDLRKRLAALEPTPFASYEQFGTPKP